MTAVDEHNTYTRGQIAALRGRDPAEVLHKFCKNPQGRLLRVIDDALVIVPPYLFPGIDVKTIYLTVKHIFMDSALAARLTAGTASQREYSAVADWLIWADTSERAYRARRKARAEQYYEQ